MFSHFFFLQNQFIFLYYFFHDMVPQAQAFLLPLSLFNLSSAHCFLPYDHYSLSVSHKSIILLFEVYHDIVGIDNGRKYSIPFNMNYNPCLLDFFFKKKKFFPLLAPLKVFITRKAETYGAVLQPLNISWLEVGRAGVRSLESYSRSFIWVEAPRHCVIIHCFPRQISKHLEGQWTAG